MKKGVSVSLIAVAIAVTMVIALGFWYLTKSSSYPHANEIVSLADAKASKGSVSEPKALQRMPDRGTPLRDALPVLRKHAEEGNGQAACRLAAEVQRCAGLALREKEHDRWLASRRRGLDAVAISADPTQLAEFSSAFEVELSKRESQLERSRAHCGGVEPSDALAQISEWRRAALLGDPTAVRQYASGNMFQRSNLVAAASAIQAYRSEAESMAVMLAKQGDLEMMLVLAASYSPGPAQFKPLLSQVVKSDAAMSWALYQRAREALALRKDSEAQTLAATIGLQIELLEQGTGPDQIARFVQTAAELDASWRPVHPVFRRYVSAEGEVPAARPIDCDMTNQTIARSE